MSEGPIITISPARVARGFLGIVAFLLVASLACQVYWCFIHQGHLKIVTYFNVDHEFNLPSWYSSSALLLAAALNLAIARCVRATHGPFVREWNGLAAMFTYLSIDEATGLHEHASGPTRSALGISSSFFHFSWVIPGAVVVLGLGAAYLRFLIHLPRVSRVRFIVAGVVFVSGALVMEMIDGRYASIHGTASFGYVLLTTLEETLEMLGIVIFNWALLHHLGAMTENLRIQVGDERPT